MSRIKVKIIKTCVLGAEGNEVNILKSQLYRFEEFCEVVGGKKETENVEKKSKKSNKVVEKKEAAKVEEKQDEKKTEKKKLFGFGKKKK